MAHNVISFGADPTGVLDSRAAFDAAIAAAVAHVSDKEVYAPAGVYDFTRSPQGAWCITLPGGITLRGDGPEFRRRVLSPLGTGPNFTPSIAARPAANPTPTILREHAPIATSTRLIRINGNNNVVRELTLDGQRGVQSANEHRHGVFIQNATGTLIEDVESREFSGDGLYQYLNANGTIHRRVYCHDNTRNGTTFGALLDGALCEDSEYTGNVAQQVDSEPVKDPNVVRNIEVRGCILDALGGTGYVLTCSGSSSLFHGRDWYVHHNVINGPIFVVWCENVDIMDNHGVHAVNRPWVEFNRSSRNGRVWRNNVTLTQLGTDGVAGIRCTGTTGQGPSLVDVAFNRVKIDHAQGYGFRAGGAINVTCRSNVLIGAGAVGAGRAGVYLRTTVGDRDFIVAVIDDNLIQNFGEFGISVAGNVSAKLLYLEALRNNIENTGGATAMTTGISLDDGTGALQAGLVAGNISGAGVVTPIANVPVGADLVFELPVEASAPAASSFVSGGFMGGGL
jgi:hypothetical protein